MVFVILGLDPRIYHRFPIESGMTIVMFFGLILIILGVIFLLQNLNIIQVNNVWSVIWPILLILIGLAYMWKRWWWHRRWHEKKEEMQNVGEKIGRKIKQKFSADKS